ncbi:MAG: PKD domain-containing protein [Bacteroidetes bacterium]|nr:PKD domain-containing protein [Bacteroidota bacterium]
MNLIYTRTIFVLGFLLMCASESKAQLVANFTADNVSGCAPLLVVFTDASTGNPSSWDWNFGDGSGNSTLQSPQHNFTTPGQYTVTLTIGAVQLPIQL